MKRDLLKCVAFQRPMIALSLVAAFSGHAAAEDSADAQQRLKAHINYLCLDALEGRGLGSKGVDLAANYIAERLRQYELRIAWYEGTPFQEFNGAMVIQLGANNRLSLLCPSGNSLKAERIDLVLGEDYIPLARGGSGKFSLPLVFAGYGLTNPEQGYDDYQEIDVAGKAAVLLEAKAPEEIHTWKVKETVARQRGASMVVFTSTETGTQRSTSAILEARENRVTQLAEECKKFRGLAKPTRAEVERHLRDVDSSLAVLTELEGSLYNLQEVRLAFADSLAEPLDPGYPILRIRRSVIDRVLKAAAQADIATLEKKIAQNLKPQSMPLSGWFIEGEVHVQRSPVEAKNVIGVVEGAGELANETVVVGAHYDGVGFRDLHWLPASLDAEGPIIIAPHTRYNPRMASPKVLHPAANDNASGTAVALEVACQLAQTKQSPRRRVVFIFFAAEEVGYIGSKAYARQPLFPLDRTVAMINLDMVGRLNKDGKVNVAGAAPPGLFSELLDRVGPGHLLQFTMLPVHGWSLDQAAFHRRNVPTLCFATGADDEIHRPSDGPDRLNYLGMQRISAMLTDFITALATNRKRPVYLGPQ